MVPVVASGLEGSTVRVPLMPLALPLMVSNGASSRKVALLTPLGSLKSKVCGAATAGASKAAASSGIAGRRRAEENAVGLMATRYAAAGEADAESRCGPDQPASRRGTHSWNPH